MRCLVLLLLCFPVHADEFVRLHGCQYTEDSSRLGKMKVHGPSNYMRDVYIRKSQVVAVHPVHEEGEPKVECVTLLLSSGRTVLVIGDEKEIFRKLFKPVVE